MASPSSVLPGNEEATEGEQSSIVDDEVGSKEDDPKGDDQDSPSSVEAQPKTPTGLWSFYSATVNQISVYHAYPLESIVGREMSKPYRVVGEYRLRKEPTNVVDLEAAFCQFQADKKEKRVGAMQVNKADEWIGKSANHCLDYYRTGDSPQSLFILQD